MLHFRYPRYAPAFFQILTYTQLVDKQNLLFYEKLLQNRGHSTLNKLLIKNFQFQLHFYRNQTVNIAHICSFKTV